MRTLLIDNYDSYTYNLFQLVAEVAGVEPLVCKNDAISLAEVRELLASGAVHNIVISPGPGSPENPTDIGVCLEIVQQLTDVPVLGVCLGHQALALAAGACIVRAPEPVHGRISELHHNGHPLLADIPSGAGQGFEVVRYHSLVVEESSLPSTLVPIAWSHGRHHAVVTAASTPDSASQRSSARQPGDTACGGAVGTSQQAATESADQPPLVMALAHVSRPHYGVQFHPESICTRYGAQLVVNFLRLASQHTGTVFQIPGQVKPHQCAAGRRHEPHLWPSPKQAQAGQGHPLQLRWRRCEQAATPRDPAAGLRLFEALCAWRPYSFWLDR